MTTVLRSKLAIVLGLPVVTFFFFCIVAVCYSFFSIKNDLTVKNTVQKIDTVHKTACSKDFKEYSQIEKRNLFRVKNAPSDLLAQAINNAKAHTSLSISKRGFSLLGTVCSEDASASRAVISYNNKELLLYAGETVNGWKIVEIHRREIVLQRGTVKERLLLDDATQMHTVKEGDVRFINRSAVREHIRDLGTLARSIEIVPLKRDGTQGLYVQSLQIGSFMHSMGLREGDMLSAVNGVPVASLADAVSLAPVLEQSRVTLEIVRNGRTQTLKFRLK